MGLCGICRFGECGHHEHTEPSRPQVCGVFPFIWVFFNFFHLDCGQGWAACRGLRGTVPLSSCRRVNAGRGFPGNLLRRVCWE